MKYDSDEYLNSKTQEADKALMAAIKAGRPSAMKIFYQRLGLLVEKTDNIQRFEFGGDFHAQIREQARRELEQVGQGTDRVGEVLTESKLLPPELRLDSRQEQDENPEMATLEVSDFPDGDVSES